MTFPGVEMAKIGVFLGSGEAISLYFLAAKQLGRSIAESGHTLVCGACGNGLMGALIGSTLDEGGEVVGILSTEVASSEVPHPKLKNVSNVATIAERKRLIRELSDIILVFPGGVGTLDEFFEAFALKRIGLFGKPIGLLNINDFYQPLISQIDKIVNDGFTKEKHRDLIVYASNTDRLLALLVLELESRSGGRIM
jgi:uncharacterized protein (TIGR00730 family)